MKNASPNAVQTKIGTERIKLSILAPLLVSILVLLITFAMTIYRLEQKNINDDIQKQLVNTGKFFHEEPDEDARLFGAIIDLLKNDPELGRLWLSRECNALNEYIAPIFRKFRDDYKITHLYFIDVNHICFLRAHNPSRFGDLITRTTLNNAVRTQAPSSGVELGVYGTFTLRTVHPWFISNTLTGYIELGEEIGHITPRLKETIDADLVFLIDKKLLKRGEWEDGQKMMGRSGNWDFLPDCVMVDSTISAIPSEFIKYIGLAHKEHKERIISAKADGSTYLAGFVKLHDASGQEIGDILVIKNVSESEAALKVLLAIVTMLCFLVAAMLISFFYVYVAGIEKRLVEARGALEAEIEKRKGAEDELRKHQERLEEIIKQRTAALEDVNRHLIQEVDQRTKAEASLEKANADLESTVTKLIRSNRQLREFAHLAAHDLKTPLRGISTLSQWLAADYKDKLDDEGRQQMDLLTKRAMRLDKLLDAILQYSTLSRNRQNERPMNINVLIDEIITEIKCPPNIKITVRNKLPVLVCDENHIRQVLYNLIDNAVKFMDKPQGLVVIDCAEKERFWEISVSDNGPGIEPQYFEKIWSLFQTLDIRDKTENTGVGLTLTRKIVELYEGKCWLKSDLGKGSTFYFTMPRQLNEAAAKKPYLVRA